MALNRISYPLFGILFLIAFSCKKENKQYPNISINAPAEQSVYAYLDTLFLELRITDLDGPVVVSLLRNGASTNLGFEQTYSKDDLRRFEAVFLDPYMLSGAYTIRVQAYNGDNRSSEFLEINYQEAPFVRTGFACVLKDGAQTQLGIKQENGPLISAPVTGDYPFISSSSGLGIIYTAPAISGKLTAYDHMLNQLYDVPNPLPSGSVQYNQLVSDRNMSYALDNDGYVKAYGEDMVPVRNFRLQDGRIPLRGGFSPNQELLIAAAEPGFQSFKLLLVNPLNGYVFQTADLDDFPVGVGYAGNSFFILCARADTSIVYEYDLQSMALTEYIRYPGEYPVDIQSVLFNACYLSTSEGLYGIFPIINPTGPVIPASQRLSGLPISDLSAHTLWDEDVYFSSGNSIFVCNGTNISLLHTINGKQIEKIEVLFNK